MGAITGWQLVRLYILVPLTIAALASGCASHRDLAPGNDGLLAWPPPAGDARQASDTVVRIMGKDYSAKGGSASATGTVLQLNHGSDLSWGMYSLSGLQQDLNLSVVELDTVIVPKTAGDGTQVYVGLANYAASRWDWQAADPQSPTYTLIVANSANYVSPEGTACMAAVLQGPGRVTLSEVRFTVIGNTFVPPPTNLVAGADVGQIKLEWDPVTVASGYNVYRSTEPDFPSAQLLNSAPIAVCEYIDDTVSDGKMYYYRVSAVRIGESDLSNMVDIFAPQVDLPIPGSPGINERFDTWVLVQWSWSSVDPPNGWYLYISQVANFSLNSPLTRSAELPFVRNSVFEGLEPGKIYYWRLVARSGAYLGRMTDDRPVTVKGFWTWQENEIGQGYAPLDLMSHDATLAAAYLVQAGVKLALGDNTGAFTVYDTPMTGSYLGEGYSDSVAVDYGNGQYVVMAHSFASDDLYGAIGQPGSWSDKIFSGDGSTAMGHEMGGYYIKTAILDSGFAVLENVVNVKPITARLFNFGWDGSSLGGSWSFEPANPTYYSMAYDGSILTLLYWADTDDGPRLFCYTSDAGTSAQISDIGIYNDLQVIGGRLVTPACSEAGELYTLTQNGASWDRELIASGAYPTGINAQLVRNGPDGAYMIFRDGSPAQNLFLGVYDGNGWSINPLLLPGVMVADHISLAALDGDPWILYTDLYRLGHVFCAKGAAPS